MKRDYDTRISQHNYEVGDLVYCIDLTKTVGHCMKIDPNIWQGLYIIARKFSGLLFEIQGKPGTRSKIVHHDRIKRYHSDFLPNWLHHKTGSFPETSCKGKIKKRPQKKSRGRLPKLGVPKNQLLGRRNVNRRSVGKTRFPYGTVKSLHQQRQPFH